MNLFDIVAPMTVEEAKASSQRLDPKCWHNKKIGKPATKVKNGVRVNNCVPKESIEEDSWSAGDNAWSSDHDQWAKEDSSDFMANDSTSPVGGHVDEDGEGTPEGLPHLTKELLTHIVQQVGTEGAHAIIKSLEWGDGAAEELLALILKDLKHDISDEEIAEHIVKVKGGYELKSKKTGKNLGKYPTRAGAEKRERQVQYFKHAGESVEEGHADQVKRVVKQGGKPVGEIGIDPEASPGNGPWYVKHYASGYDVVGFDSPEEALEELKYCVKQGVTEAGNPAQQAAIAIDKKKHHQKPKTESDDFDDGDWEDDPTVHAVSRPAQQSNAPVYPDHVNRAIAQNPQYRNDIINAYKRKQQMAEDEKRELYRKTQDAPTKQALDKAYRTNPSAKTDTEALASLLARELDNLEKEKETNQDQDQEIQTIKNKINKAPEKKSAPTAEPVATKQPTTTTVLKPAVNPVTGTPEKKPVQVPVSNVIPMPIAKTAPAPTPKATVAPVDNAPTVAAEPTAMPAAGVQQPAIKPAAMPAVQPTAQTTAEPTKASQPATSPAIGQMAKVLSTPTAPANKPSDAESPFKGKGLAPSTAGILGIGGSPMASKVNQPSPADTTSTDSDVTFNPADVLPSNVFNISSKKKEVPLTYRPVKKTGTGGRFAAMHEAETTSPAIAQMVNTLAPDAGAQRQFPAQSAIEQTIQQNAQAWANSYKGGRPASLSFGPAHVTLPADEIQSLHQYIMTHYKDPDDQGSVFRQILSDLNKLRIVRQTVNSLQQQLPLQQNEQQMSLGLTDPDAKNIHDLDSDIDQARTKPNFDRTGKMVNKKPVTQQTMNRAYGQTAKQVRPAPELNPVKATIQYFNRKTDQYELRTSMFNSEAEAQQVAQRVAGHITSISPLMAESYWDKLQNERCVKVNSLVNELKESIEKK